MNFIEEFCRAFEMAVQQRPRFWKTYLLVAGIASGALIAVQILVHSSR